MPGALPRHEAGAAHLLDGSLRALHPHLPRQDLARAVRDVTCPELSQPEIRVIIYAVLRVSRSLCPQPLQVQFLSVATSLPTCFHQLCSYYMDLERRTHKRGTVHTLRSPPVK